MRGVLAVCLLAMLSIAGAARTQQAGDGAVFEPSRAISRTEMLAAADRMATWLSGDKRGLQLSTTLAPAVGRVLVDWRDGDSSDRQECSGVLVGPNSVLTAAHCVCGRQSNDHWYRRDGAGCAGQLAHVSATVVFPGHGVFATAGPARILPAYRSAQEALPRGTAVADLAVLTLAAAPPIAPLPIGHGDPARAHLLVSFGKLTLSDVREGSSWKADTGYQSGVKQVSRTRELTVAAEECGKQPAADTVCTLYDGIPNGGQQMDDGACGGDSGGPLLEVAPDGALSVVGITSYYIPQGQEVCTATEPRLTHYVAVERYAAWIAAAAGTTPPDERCGEALVKGSGRFALPAPTAGAVTVTAFGFDGYDRPIVALSGGSPGACRTDAERGWAHCRIDQAQRPVVALKSGMAQIAMCWKS